MLAETIINRIESEGPISFHDFMEMALYYPGSGYYCSEGCKVGRNGDYFTAPYSTPLFGELVGKQIEEMWYVLDKQPFTIIEIGAGDGSLCRDILHRLMDNSALYQNLSYIIIEKSAPMRMLEQINLSEKVSWCNSLSDISSIKGCILANEVLDNFAVHRVVMGQELMEINVGYSNGFYEFLSPASKPLTDYFNELRVKLSKGFCAEVNLEANEWINQAARVLQKGFVLTIDYGYPSYDLYSPSHRSGTMLCYYHNSVNDYPYQHIGEQDITSHVNFSALNHWGIKHGFSCCGYTDQSHFLHALGLGGEVRNLADAVPRSHTAEREAISSLNTLLLSMGKNIKVMALQKGFQRPLLTGFMFSRPLA
jgi:SAM-dependent MidA family methyltransferase